MVMKKHLIFALSITFLFISCSKENYTKDNNIIVLGHGGMGIGQTYPMNSYESILKSLNTGADGTEIDVQMTKDSVLVAYHSSDLSDKTNFSGKINDFDWSEIENAFYMSTPYLNYSILSLDELFSNIGNLKDYKFTFDCKLYTNGNPIKFQKVFISSLAKIVDKYDLKSNVYIESQDTRFLTQLKERDENYKLFIYPSSFKDGLNIALELDLYGITISTEDVSHKQIEQAHSNNLKIAIWNTYSKKRNIEGVNKRPDFIQTDRVKHLVRLLK